MKQLNDFRIKTDYLCQVKGAGRYNAIDANFLTCNFEVQKFFATGKKPLRNEHIKAFSKLGSIVRFPFKHYQDEESRLWDDPRTVSRDNSLGCLIALNLLCGKYGLSECRAFALKTIKRWSFFQNTHTVKGNKKLLPDWCGPDSWAVLLRACFEPGNSKALGLMLMPLDLMFTVNIMVFLVHCFFVRDYNSPLFHMISTVYFCNHSHGNIVTRFNKWLLLTKTPVNKEYSIKSGYFRREWKEGFNKKYGGVISQLGEYSRASYDPPIYDVTWRLLSGERK